MLVDDFKLVCQWTAQPGRTGPKTDASITHYKKILEGWLESAGKPVSQMTIADITKYVDGGGSTNGLGKVLRFLDWAYAYDHINHNLVYAYEHQNPHIVKTDKVWETQDQELFEAWVASRSFKNATTERHYRLVIMRVWSYFSGPLATLTSADVKVMTLTLSDRGIGDRFARWLAQRSIAVASPDVPVPDVPVPDSSETLARMQAELAVLNNTVETLTANSNILVKFDLAGKLRIIEARQEGMQSDISTLAGRIHDLEASKPAISDAWQSLAKRMGHLEALWGRQLDERLANSDRRYQEIVAVVNSITTVVHRLVKACYTGTSPIHPLDGKDLQYLNDVMTEFPVRDASAVPLHRNGGAPALVDSDPRTDT